MIFTLGDKQMEYFESFTNKELNWKELTHNILDTIFSQSCILHMIRRIIHYKQCMKSNLIIHNELEWKYKVSDFTDKEFDEFVFNYAKSKVGNYEHFIKLYELINDNSITFEEIPTNNYNGNIGYYIFSISPSRPIIDSDEVYNLIHDQTLNAFKSYKGNWVMNAFNSQRQEEVFNYMSHKVNTIDKNKLKLVFEQIINEISQIDVKPYGE